MVISCDTRARVTPKWVPVLDASRSPEREYVTLLVKLYRHRKRGFILSLNRPFPPRKVRPKRIYQNIIHEGLKLQSFIKNSPTRMTWAKAGKKLQMSDSKIAHLLKIINKLPPDFVENMRSCADETTLKIFTGRRLLSISRLKTEKERQNEINRLLTIN